eukprot:998858-Alexandrium_andersonii.AAC.1
MRTLSIGIGPASLGRRFARMRRSAQCWAARRPQAPVSATIGLWSAPIGWPPLGLSAPLAG